MSEITDREFVRTFTIVMSSIAAIGVIAFLVANNVGEERVSSAMAPEKVAERLAPVGKARLTGEPEPSLAAKPAAAEPRAAMSGKDVVTSACASCHATGVMNAPKIGDQAAWDARLAAAGGLDALVASAAKGKGAMPPKGGKADLTDAELHAAVAELSGKGGDEAAAPAAPAATPAPAAAPAAAAPAAVAAPVAAAPAAAPAAPAVDGSRIYQTSCQGCHAAGVMNAPKPGDHAAWAPRMAQGMATVMGHVMNGLNGMPPRGTCMNCTEAELAAAVHYMAGQ